MHTNPEGTKKGKRRDQGKGDSEIDGHDRVTEFSTQQRKERDRPNPHTKTNFPWGKNLIKTPRGRKRKESQRVAKTPS